MGWDYGTLAAEVYDLDKPPGLSFGDVEYYTRELSGVTGPILEAASGTGRILIPLLEAALTVEGVDSSADMLAHCRKHCRERGLDPVLHEADMTSFVRPGAYQAVIVPAGSIVLLDGRAQTQRALAAFRECLAPRGRLMVEMPAPRLGTEPEPTRYWRDGPQMWTLQTMHIEYDAAANQKARLLRYEKWRDGALVATELQVFRLQYWSLAEFGQLLAEAGFTDVSVTADYEAGSPPGPDSGDWCFTATRS